MERQIRALKREVNAGGDKAALGSRIRQKTREYNAFSRAVDIRPKTERLRVVGVDGGIGLHSTGGLSGAKKTKGWQDRHADSYYAEVRSRAAGDDAAKIAKYTPFKETAVEEIRQHVFIREHELDGVRQRFASSFEQAQAWQRLVDGKGTETDLVFLRHEYVELTQMRLHGYTYEEAHPIANKKHNWYELIVPTRKEE